MGEVRVDPLTRVEGLGRVLVFTEGEEVRDVRLEIFEPPRFFERLLVGKRPDQVVDIVARICGLCPVAYQITAVEAFEKIFDVKVPPHLRKLRRALYCGEWISSHAAHIFFLHLPDFFDRESFLDLAKVRRDLIEAGLRIRKVGNSIIETIGGRSIHPVNVRVGGFYRLPSERALEGVMEDIEEAYSLAWGVLDELLSLPYPQVEKDRPLVSLGGVDEYPIMEGRIVCSDGTEIDKEEYEGWFEEYQLPHSTALYSRLKDGRSYEVGALARVSNNFEKLPEEIREKVKDHLPSTNPFKSILARMVEVIYALGEAKKTLERMELGAPHVDFQVKEGEGIGITEAPRGILFHRYRVNKEGIVEFSKIVPPTSQNQRAMEEDLLLGLRILRGDLRKNAEKLIRNFDPCISCASHFIEIVRAPSRRR